MRRSWCRVVGVCAALAASSMGALAASGEVAKIASLQNRVETRTRGAWVPSTVNQALLAQDRVRTGPASRAAILYPDHTLHRLNERSEIEVLPPGEGRPGVLRVLSGQHYFSSRAPKQYGRIETPTVTAAIRGTEFVVTVAEDTTTTITMLEGVVEASNEHGTLTVTRGEEAYVEPGKAPVRRIVVRPRDAVMWALQYPPVLSGADAERLRGMGAEGEDLARAAALLGAGQVDDARPLIESARARDPHGPLPLALASVVAVVADDRDEALRLARRAVEADPSSSAAALALSIASQARLDLRAALDAAEKAAQLDPEGTVAWSRVAELRMAHGDLDGARSAVERAVRRAPDDARALTVLGFVELAQFRSVPALAAFERAVATDAAYALARLGLGIARIRTGQFVAGREEIQTAVVLDPQDALLRSYLGKALYEERLPEEAWKELTAAKELDASDPTPHLYAAILLQNENRPVEALDELQSSIAKNDRRAVYRSRLLLDEDRAVRGSDLARVYNDLGFEELGMVSARRSADADQANHSSHLVLAGTYRTVAGFAPAFLSELLQARIYQPPSVNAARPDLVNESVSFNEYTALFDRPRARGFGEVALGRADTGLGELFPPGAICTEPDGSEVPCSETVQLDDSDRDVAEVVGTMNGDRYAAALGFRRTTDDGFRINNDQRNENWRAFAQYAPTWRDSIQLSFLRGTRDSGDLPLREIPVLIAQERFETELTNVGLGYHRSLSPSADLAVSAIYNDTEQIGSRLDLSGASSARLHGPQLALQHGLRRDRATLVSGAGTFSGDFELRSGATTLAADEQFANGYAYLKLRDLGPFDVTAGASFERVESPVGLLPPRDSQIAPALLSRTDSRLSPKLGVTMQAGASTVLRAAAYSRLTPGIGRLQTLEPTQVAGFNQFFDEPGGTRSFSWGFGVDQTFGRRVFGGISLLRRNRTVPEASCAAADPFSGCAGQVPTLVRDRDSNDRLESVYLNAAIGRRVALSAEYAHAEREFDFTQMSPLAFFEDFVETQRFRPEVRVFLPFGLYAAFAATRYDQRVDQFDDLSSPVRFLVQESFWLQDLELGYRLPRRWGSIVLDARNLSDREFVFFQSAIEEVVLPARTVVLRLNVTY